MAVKGSVKRKRRTFLYSQFKYPRKALETDNLWSLSIIVKERCDYVLIIKLYILYVILIFFLEKRITKYLLYLRGKNYKVYHIYFFKWTDFNTLLIVYLWGALVLQIVN